MNIKNVFITGASGKIGRNVIPELIKAGYKIRALRFDNEPVDFKNIEIIDGDIRDSKLASKALKDMDAVIHLANCKENKELFMETNVKGTYYLLDEAKKIGIKQFIQAGSDARAGIFYYPHPFPIDENYPHSAYPGYYAFSKVIEEVMCEQYFIQYKLPITILRFSWVHDEDDILAHITLMEPNFGVPIWSDLAETKEQKRYFEKGIDAVVELDHSDGKPGMRHIVGIKDVVDGIMLAINNPATIGQAFAIAGPAPFSYSFAAKYISDKLNLPIVKLKEENFYDFKHDINKSRSILGYNPKYDIVKIIDDAIAFRKSDKKRTPNKYIG